MKRAWAFAGSFPLAAGAAFAGSLDGRFVLACDLVSDEGVITTEIFEMDAESRTSTGSPFKSSTTAKSCIRCWIQVESP